MASKKISDKKIIIGLVIIVLIIAAIFVITILMQRVKFNEGNVTGNTAGNLNNGGLFCESGGIVYFSNPYDNGCLYSMTPEETDIKKLTEITATSINADSNHLYYYLDSTSKGVGLGYIQRTYGVYRSRLNGKRTACLVRGNAITLQLSGNYIYYQFFDNHDQKGTQLYKVKIDKSETSCVADYQINPACCVDGILYYNGTRDDHYLYSMNTTANDSISLLWEGDMWNPVYDNGYFYYMDVSSNYRLCRYLIAAGTTEVLTEDRIDFFNTDGNTIYYQRSSQTDPALMRMSMDGSNAEMVAAGVYHNINMTSSYVYFTEYNSTVPMYRTPVGSAVHVTPFDAAEQAALAAIK